MEDVRVVINLNQTVLMARFMKTMNA
jgi:hypothetical protein